jgi:hypothetical protein
MPPLTQSEGEGNKAISPSPAGTGKTMASFYSVLLTGSNQMQVAGNHGEVAFNVTNTTNSPLQTRFDLGRAGSDKADADPQAPWHPTLPQDSPLKKWLTVQTAPCRIDPKGTVQVIVKLQAPPETEGTYQFCIIAAAAPRTDEDFTTGPQVSFTLRKTGNPAPPHPIKWWMILIGAVLVLAIVGGIVALIMHKGGVPNVVGETSNQATQALQKAGLQVKTNSVFSPGKTDGIVLDETPASGAALPDNKIVVLDVASSLPVVPCVEGKSLSDAAAQLRAAGLLFDGSAFTTDGNLPSGFVVSQNPRNQVCTPQATGLKVAPGSKVYLTIKK